MNPWKISTLFLAVLLMVVVGTQGLRAERQPHMRNALASLQAARDELQKATADKGGHRVKAIALTNEAIEQVKKGIAFDNTRAELPAEVE
jgi:hypothetical protein